ncbi:probable rhamnogalacturonate lyase B [Humulus lupulus]|uniref:probable rhamnogalacturonate lyase B n=1 Tax=Humulus lupulus TaxID=3486 RepID=UPI002B4152DD|nr:probable rhamnogalacturonate lyase B [Humulus lupulus]
MKSENWRKRFNLILCSSLYVILHLCFLPSSSSLQTKTINSTRGPELVSSSSTLRIRQTTQRHRKVVILDNGLVQLTFSNPHGDVIGIRYNNIKNLLENGNKYGNRGYWDIQWGEGTTSSSANNYERLVGTRFEIITANDDQIEISFTKRWNDSSKVLPINLDKRYIMLRDYPGFYTYGILEHPKDAPAIQIGVIRASFKLKENKFNYMAISDDRQRIMPSALDRKKGQKLAYPEAVLLTNPSNPNLKGEVDDKYQYSSDHKEIRVHGWISSNPSIGFWIITPSHEFLTAGPTKQELTSHVGPTSLSVFMSCHYVGKHLIIKLEKGEEWKKVFGPIPIFLNSVSSNPNPHSVLWENAKSQAKDEGSKWPYNFINSKDFPLSNQRGSVKGQLFVQDRYLNKNNMKAKFAYIGLAAPGKVGSWQWENKGYQFWNEADTEGNFFIKNVRPGNYNLYAWIPGVIGDYMYNRTISVEPGSTIDLYNIVYIPPRNGPTLWEIGIPDRTASEFYVPDPLPNVTNRLFTNQSENKFRQYGLWDRYTDLYPKEDLIYTIGVSDYRRDWFFAHVNRKLQHGKYQHTTWQVKFKLEEVILSKNYTLQLALASASLSSLQIRFNEDTSYRPLYATHLLGRDNSIPRHGIHGSYWIFSINILGNRLHQGENTLYLTQAKSVGPFGGLFYDYLRFEAPSQT